MVEHHNRWHFLRYVAVELVAVFVPLDRIQLLAIQIKVALEIYSFPAHHVLRHHQLQHPQAVCFCKHTRGRGEIREKCESMCACICQCTCMYMGICVEHYANVKRFQQEVLLKEIKLDTDN